LDGIDWDDKVKPQSLIKWKKITENSPKICEINIPKWIQFTPQNQTEIHGFCDASEKAYCATVFLRSHNETTTESILLVAKSKVAPLKTVSLPRLE
ncbi:hypothetical protein ACYT7O_10335, partial [Streptococcus pyogenes]